MHVRTIAGAALAVGLLLTGCSNNGDGNDKPSTPKHSTVAPTRAALSKTEVARRCITALVQQATEDASADVGATRPRACAQLGDGEYADAILKATQQANAAGRGELQDKLDEVTGHTG
ncbi:hypothetical protein JK364_23885 [Streptomyces sp. 110]|uniref:Lipoprotein n=1 Tax=Streptomyces endocoffeicus TaxID=2898945 RepID=A0ABS1PSL0_9ACTN|nr:hypothetical protein [Streptomyces endocoffeicus]MBL1115415.1 hypothetical protein [Streptomyces endocoffeicus]